METILFYLIKNIYTKLWKTNSIFFNADFIFSITRVKSIPYLHKYNKTTQLLGFFYSNILFLKINLDLNMGTI